MYSSTIPLFLIIGWNFFIATIDGNSIPHFVPGVTLEPLTLKEDTPLDIPICQLKGHDNDGDALVFGIEGPNRNFFIIKQINETDANVFLQQQLDRETCSEIRTTFTLTDGKISHYIKKPCTIFVIDVNDEVPRFINLKPRIVVPENTTVDSIISNIEAEDHDQGMYGSITFSLKDSDTFSIETVNPNNGTAVLILKKELDYEKQELYNLEIIAMDAPSLPLPQRNTAAAIIVIEVADVQDSPPRFIYAPSFVKIEENAPIGYTILKFKAEDEDRGIPNEIVYNITSVLPPEGMPLFQLDENTGLLSVKEPIEKKANPEVKELYILNIMAKEIQYPHDSITTQLSIFIDDVNDYPPTFANSSYVGQILENSPKGMTVTFPESYITLVKDFDQGKNGRFDLYIDDNEIFQVLPVSVQNEANFILQVKDPRNLDYEITKTMEFKLTAVEVLTVEKWSSQITIRVNILDANDHSPEFEKEEYTAYLSENATNGDQVIQVQAKDIDDGVYGDVRYVNLQGTMAEKFALDPVSGHLIVNSSAGFDRENIAQYFLILEAEDNQGNQGNRAVTRVTVKLVDINDNIPQFTQSVYRVNLKDNAASFQNPIIVKAIDNDEHGNPNSDIRYSIADGDDNHMFTINAVTGELMLVQPLNYEKTSINSTDYQIFNLSLMATDLGHPPLSSNATVLIYPEDYWSGVSGQAAYNSRVRHSKFSWSLWFTITLVIILAICLMVVSTLLHQQMKKNKIGPEPSGFDKKDKSLGRTQDEKYISVCSNQP